MPRLTANRVPIRVRSFNSGQNSSAEPTLSAEPSVLENTIITDLGQAEQRKGLTRVGDNPDSLISLWTFDASDSTDDKASNDGTDTAVTYVDGKFGKCASFNGTTSKITVSADTTIDVNSMGPFRISAWVYVDSDGENDEGRIVDKFSGSDVGYKLYVHGESSSTVKLTFEVGFDTTNAKVVTSTTMSTGAWHKVDAVFNSDDSVDIYIDGALASYSTDTTGSGSVNDDSAVDLIIGNNTGQTRTFDGEIDDFRVYDGTFTVDDIELKQIRGMTRFKSGATDLLLRIKNTDLQKLSADFKSWTNIDTGFTADKTTNFVQADDKIFVLNDTDNVHSMDTGETVTDEGNTNTDPPRALYGEWANNNRFFILDGDLVYFSDALDPQTYDRANNLFRVRKGSRGVGRWLKMFKEFELIIYMDESIHVLDMNGSTPLTDWNLKPLSITVGCPAGRTVQDIGNDHIFLARDGVRLLSRTPFDKLQVGVISERIQDIIDGINWDSIGTACSWFEDNKYILSVPTGTSAIPDRTVIWDSIAAKKMGDPAMGWTVLPKDDWCLSVFSTFEFGDNLLTVVAGDSRDLSLTYKVLSGNTDNGQAITQRIIGAEIDFGDRVSKKIFDPLQVIAHGGSDSTYTVELELDRKGSVQVGTLSTTGALITPFTTPATTGSGGRKEKTMRTKRLGRGNTARVTIKHEAYNKRPTFVEYTLYARNLQGRAS